ncbi:hypothetical protein P9112_003542 [Eukaryota sp. TZLM1-RC]
MEQHLYCLPGVKSCSRPPSTLPPRATKRISKRHNELSAKQPKKGTIEAHFNQIGTDALNKAIAMFFYRNGIPFNATRTKEFNNMVTMMTSANFVFCLPSYNALRTNLLEEVKHSIELRLVPLFEKIRDVGCTLPFDGWTDPSGNSLTNFVLIAGSEAMFYDCVNTFGKKKDANIIFLDVDNIIQLFV